MDLRAFAAGMALVRRFTRAFAFGLLALYALVMFIGQTVNGAPPPFWAWGLPVLFAGVVWFDVRRLLARTDEVRQGTRFDLVQQQLSSLDADARAAHLRRIQRRMLVGGGSVLASAITLLLVPGDYPRAVACIWLWLIVSAVFAAMQAAGFLLVRRWMR